MSTLLQELNADLSAVIDEVRRSLVRVSIGMGNGAGTIWHPDGLIVTNAHVVGELDFQRARRAYYGGRAEDELQVTLPDGRTLPARILAKDTERDLAALSIAATDLPTIQLGDSRKLKAGEWVFAVGHPWGVPGAASAGVVVGTGAELPEITHGRDWIVMNLKVRPGNSGGPLVDSRGRLVGINTLLTGPQVGAAVPVHTVRAFLKETLGSPIANALEMTL